MVLTSGILTAVISAASALVGSLVGSVVLIVTSYLTRKQLNRQLELQSLVSERSAASFIADKRQCWIDELRADMSTHIALTQEIAWKWDAFRHSVKLKVQNEAAFADEIKNKKIADSINQEAIDKFSPENGARDRDHHELHIRIIFRLNPKEALHITMIENLKEIRTTLSDLQKKPDENDSILDKISRLVSESEKYTQEILSQEWRKVKQEVAYPEALISKIPKPF